MSVECRSALSMKSNSVLTDADSPVSESLNGAANTVKHLLQRLTARTSSANIEHTSNTSISWMYKQRTVGKRRHIFTLTGRVANCLAGSVVPRAVPLLWLPSVRLSIRRPPRCDVMTHTTYAAEDLRCDMKPHSYLFLNFLPPWDFKKGLLFWIIFCNISGHLP